MNWTTRFTLVWLAGVTIFSCTGDDHDSLENLVAAGARKITTLSIRSPTEVLSVGETQQLQAIAQRSDGTEFTLTEVTWQTDDKNIIDINTSGEMVAMSIGTTQVRYEYLGQNSSLPVTVTPATIQRLQLSPPLLTLDECSSTSVTAEAVYSDGSIHTPSNTLVWSVSDQEIAHLESFEAHQNTINVVSTNSGTTVLSATYEDITNTVEVVATDALSNISLDTPSIAIETGNSLLVPVYGTFADGRQEAIDQFVTFTNENIEPLLSDEGLLLNSPGVDHTSDTTSSAPQTIQISTPYTEFHLNDSNQLMLTAKSAGVDMISIECGGLSTLLEVQVTEPVILQSVSINTENTALNAGEGIQLSAVANYSDGTTEALVTPSWEVISGDSDSFNLDTDTGVISAVDEVIVEQSVEVRVGHNDFHDTIVVYAQKGVTEKAVALNIYFTDSAGFLQAVNPETPLNLTKNQEVKLSANISFNTGRTEFTTEGIYWSNADPDIAVVNAQGTVSAIDSGITSITVVDQLGNKATINVLVTPEDPLPDPVE